VSRYRRPECIGCRMRYGKCGKFPQAPPAVRSELRPSVIVVLGLGGSVRVGRYMTDDARSARYERYEEARRQTCSDSPRDSSSINLDELRERAQTQRDMLERERVAASREALQGDA
jgi:hypothetical protein